MFFRRKTSLLRLHILSSSKCSFFSLMNFFLWRHSLHYASQKSKCICSDHRDAVQELFYHIRLEIKKQKLALLIGFILGIVQNVTGRTCTCYLNMSLVGSCFHTCATFSVSRTRPVVSTPVKLCWHLNICILTALFVIYYSSAAHMYGSFAQYSNSIHGPFP